MLQAAINFAVLFFCTSSRLVLIKLTSSTIDTLRTSAHSQCHKEGSTKDTMVGIKNKNSPEEAKAIEEFQAIVSDLGQDEATCRRFLRARNHDKTKAEDMLRKSLQWRAKHNLDDWLNWVIPQEITDAHYITYDGKDKKGRAVIYITLGKWDVRKYIQAGWKEDMDRNILVVLETIDKARRESSHEQFFCIVDLEGYTLQKWLNYDAFQMVTEVFRFFEANYPETLYKAVVINAPWIFSQAFPLVKPLMSGHTLSKVTIYDSNIPKWREALLEELPLQSLPQLPEIHNCPST